MSGRGTGLRVRRGSPTADELAAVTAVLLALARARDGGAGTAVPAAERALWWRAERMRPAAAVGWGAAAAGPHHGY
ncbi:MULTISPECIES: acyl-CoA carboxylase subunit epsilon [unclassified Streptomyces]|uniref:acyl-CoA carboxylase subunit epsilon n=1 Tax=unclassified Streptomyces TaxID=2593676 RepID=UPI003D74FCE7